MIHLSPGWNNLMVDLSQAKRNDGSGKIDTGAIIQYVFCLIKPASETILYLDNIRLEKTQGIDKTKGIIDISINAETNITKISPLIFGTNLAPKTTDTVPVRNFIEDMGLTIFRYPGGDGPGYHWKTSTYDFWTQKPYMFDLTKYDRVAQMCQDTNTQLTIELNLESGTPQEAAEWVEYTNKKLGFYVMYWELGNEAFGKWAKSHRTAEQYALNIQEYSVAMKSIDPTIKIGADWAGEYFGNWDEIVMRTAGQYIDFLSYHWYPSHVSPKQQYQGKSHPEPLDIAANAFRIPNIMQRMRLIIRKECPQKINKIEFAFLEWDGACDAPWYNPEPYEQGIMQWSMANALFYAETYAQFIQQGVTVANSFKLQETPYGFIRGHMTENPPNNVMWDGLTIRPKAFVVKLFRKHFGEVLVNSEIRNVPTYNKASDWYDASYSGKVPFLTCIASKNEGNNKLFIMLINRHPSDTLPVNITVSDFIFAPKAKAWILTGPEITSQNDGAPGTVKITEEGLELPNQNFIYNCPAHSVVSIEIDKAPS
jgi:alpha-L-arabinofuranosidase